MLAKCNLSIIITTVLIQQVKIETKVRVNGHGTYFSDHVL